jgi:TolB-like protein/Tfp pilus assembly protein PilF
MAADIKKEIKLEIGHVLFMDIVGYSKLLINEQRARRETLTQIVRGTETFREADATGTLIKSPTGDGMALVFRGSPEDPVECALEISRALKSHPEIPLRMGIHSGPVSAVVDVNDTTSVAGAGINMGQRVMDCGDAGHILISKHVAEDLEQYAHWQPHLHDLGECEVKHGVRVGLANLYSDEFGNPKLPEKFKTQRKQRRRKLWIGTGVGLATAIAIGAVLFFVSKRSTSSLPEKSIAVLPFENLSRDPDNAFFADGVQDAILTNLAKVADLKVISRTSVMQYKTELARNMREIGKQLGVAHLLEGSVQRAAGKVRVNAQLIDARNDAHLWAEIYDRDLADVFAIQSEIAKTIADQLRAKLSQNEKAEIEQRPTKDLDAYELYTRANAVIFSTSFATNVRERLLEAADLLNKAIARDPAFFLAYCQLAYAHADLYLNQDHTPARLALADAAVQNALRLRPDAGEAHLTRAQQLYECYLDYDAALRELEIARRTLPNDPRVAEFTGYILRRRGKLEDGLASLQRSLDLDPRNLYTLQQIALSYFQMQRYPEMAATLDRALSIKPDDVDLRVARAFVDLNWKADTRPLHKTIAEVRAANPDALKGVADNWFVCALAERDSAAATEALEKLGDNTLGDDALRLPKTFGLGALARMNRDEAKAHAAFTQAREDQQKQVQAQPDYGPTLCVLALIDAGLGRKKEALEEARRAAELMPVEKDTLNGAHIVQYNAIAAAWVGEKDLALQQLERAVQIGDFGPTTYGQLKLLPYWDPLRGDPRFEQIVESQAPK